ARLPHPQSVPAARHLQAGRHGRFPVRVDRETATMSRRPTSRDQRTPAMSDNPFVGTWTYRSLLNEPSLATDFDKLEFGRGTIVIAEGPMQILSGTIGGPGWSLTLKGARQYGSPMHARFQGTGTVDGEKWIYDYDGYLVPHWPNGVDQRPAIVG